MRCTDCPYHWKEDDERFARCHFEPHCADDLPPCEIDDYDEYYGEEE